MRITTQADDNLIAELNAIREEINLNSGGIEDRINNLAHNIQCLIEALIVAEEQE